MSDKIQSFFIGTAVCSIVVILASAAIIIASIAVDIAINVFGG